MGDWLSVGLVVSSLALFALSTRQFQFWVRVAVLLLAATALGWAALGIGQSQGHYLFDLIGDIWRNRSNSNQSAVAIAVDRNYPSVGRHVVPLLDLFVVMAAALGAVAVFALTPGERTERTVRPLFAGLIGAMIGAGLTLVFVAVGFGGPIEPRVYVGRDADIVVRDGDTLIFGDASLRLLGVDAPELTQRCVDRREPCGEIAKAYLERVIAESLVVCRVSERATGNVAKTFGRPLARCFAQTPSGESFDIAELLILTGHATAYAPNPSGYERVVPDQRHPEYIDHCWFVPGHSLRLSHEPRRRVGFCPSSDSPR